MDEKQPALQFTVSITSDDVEPSDVKAFVGMVLEELSGTVRGGQTSGTEDGVARLTWSLTQR